MLPPKPHTVNCRSDFGRCPPIDAQFAKSSQPFVPSLDDTAPHPLDSQISSMELKLAIQIIESACAQLCVTVARRVLAIRSLIDLEKGKLGRILRLLVSKHVFREVTQDLDVFANNRL